MCVGGGGGPLQLAVAPWFVTACTWAPSLLSLFLLSMSPSHFATPSSRVFCEFAHSCVLVALPSAPEVLSTGLLAVRMQQLAEAASPQMFRNDCYILLLQSPCVCGLVHQLLPAHLLL